MTPRRALSILGSVLAAAGIAYVGLRLYRQAPDVQFFTAKSWAALSVAAAVYACAMGLLALAWQRILNHLGIFPDKGWVFGCYADYQVSKYVPGNVANIIGRQLHGAKKGYAQKPMALSTVIELAGVLLCGSVFWVMWLLMQADIGLSMALTAGFFTFAGASLLIRMFGSHHLLVAALCQMVFLAVSGSIYASLVWWLAVDLPVAGFGSFVALVCVFNAAWLVGVVTPGAPAGVGVRDGLLLSWSSALLHSELIAFVVLVSRLATLLGDLVFWLAVRRPGRGSGVYGDPGR